MRAARTRWIATGLAVCAVLAAGCPRNAGREAAGGKQQAAGSSEEQTDRLAWALGHDSADVNQFALLAIEHYHLDGYQEQLHKLAADNAVAALVLAAVYQNPDAPYDYFVGQPAGKRVGNVLGAAYGLGCAREVPAAAWLRLLAEAGDQELTELLWGMAQLDVEPGGPLERSEELSEQWGELRKPAEANGDVNRRGALDALLGYEGGEIDWPVYTDYLPDSHWNAVQWSALLRWAPEEVWQTMLGDAAAQEAIKLELGKALILRGPASIGLPGSDARLITMGLGLELRAVKFVQGKVDTMEVPELDTLVGQADLAAQDTTDQSDEDRFRQQAYQLALSSVLQLLDYALVLDDKRLVARLIDAMPNLPEIARGGILATIVRRDPDALSDDQLAVILGLEDGGADYFLLEGWFDREVVQQSDAVKLVAALPGQENEIAAYAYLLWMSRQ